MDRASRDLEIGSVIAPIFRFIAHGLYDTVKTRASPSSSDEEADMNKMKDLSVLQAIYAV